MAVSVRDISANEVAAETKKSIGELEKISRGRLDQSGAAKTAQGDKVKYIVAEVSPGPDQEMMTITNFMLPTGDNTSIEVIFFTSLAEFPEIKPQFKSIIQSSTY